MIHVYDAERLKANYNCFILNVLQRLSYFSFRIWTNELRQYNLKQPNLLSGEGG